MSDQPSEDSSRDSNSPFEQAVDAIVNGDLDRLVELLTADPQLVHTRSNRDHHSTLLHYVSANGVEDDRQKTPSNCVAITKYLLDSGADVLAESDAYGGGATTLGLTATSCHPEQAGVQLDLLQLLLDRGARFDAGDPGATVNGCLRNGRGAAAKFLADRGAHVDLEGAGGVGKLNVYLEFIERGGKLTDPFFTQQLQDGFAWASQFGHVEIVDYLLNQGMPVATRLKHHQQTALHWAAWNAHIPVVDLLLSRGADVTLRDAVFDGTPLDWGLYAWSQSSKRNPQYEQYYTTIDRLLNAGSQLDPEWYSPLE